MLINVGFSQIEFLSIAIWRVISVKWFHKKLNFFWSDQRNDHMENAYFKQEIIQL